MRHQLTKVKALLTVVATVAMATATQAQFLTSTGQLSSGGLDSRWQISTDGGGAWTAASLVTSPPSPWVAVPGGSWISATSSASGGGGNYRIRQQFTLGAGDALSFSLACSIDNTLVGLYVNGALASASACSVYTAFGPTQSFTAANFVTGQNTIEVRWTGDNTTDGAAVAISNLAYTPGTPTNPSVVPEPSTYALMATGLVGLVGLGRRRRTNR